MTPFAKLPWEIAGEIIAAIAIAANVVMVIRYWSQLPATVPMHFNIRGQADLFGPKITIWIGPAIALACYILMSFIAKNMGSWNYPVPINQDNANIQAQIGLEMLIWMKAEMMVMLVFLEWQVIRVALGKSETFNVAAIFAMLGLIIATSIFYLVQALANK
ncbi:MAG TPA: DUF1648 domain-containing protein [Oscillatoriaceae cyanobacterium M33_DOE_052]|uniref:DUF1648 domain-containing protein n=1 Tax=Planktothricoides sp. SpSt-374 TaxID=2282167 RepID=A0A7C3ZU88_9CYAN|nr:DUF1648 domain-containing protein [Oscillatoriaceae cyanobacterium M33_DOE_052]